MMKRYGKKILAILAIIMTATVANAATLIDHWTFDETSGTTLTNEVAGRSAVTMENFTGSEWSTDTPTALAYSTGSLSFDQAAEQFLSLGSRSGYDGGTGNAFTISLWVKPDGNGGGDMRLFNAASNDIPSSLVTTCLRINTEVDAVQNYTPNAHDWVSAASITMDQWQNVIFVFEDATMTTYVNGDLKSSLANCLVDYTALGCELVLGGKFYSASAGKYYGVTYSGLIDDVAVWDGALTTSEITTVSGGANPTSVPEPTTSCGLIALLLGGFFLRRHGYRF